jgi:hypothetical protein
VGFILDVDQTKECRGQLRAVRRGLFKQCGGRPVVVAAMDLAKSTCANRVRGRYASQHREASSNATELRSTLFVENKIRDLKVSLRRPQTATRILKTRPLSSSRA